MVSLFIVLHKILPLYGTQIWTLQTLIDSTSRDENGYPTALSEDGLERIPVVIPELME